MSALQVNSDNRIVDPGHQLEALIDQIKPNLSHLTSRPPIAQRIFDTNDEELQAFCEPINATYVLTSQGLAYVPRRKLFARKPAPRLISHVGLSTMIDPRDREQIIEKLNGLIASQARLDKEKGS